MHSQALVQVVSPSRPSRSFGGFARVQDYVERFTAAVAVLRSDSLTDVADPADAMDQLYLAAEKRAPNPAYHFVLSWRDENIEHRYVWATVRRCLESIKLIDHQWLAAIHGDTAHTHAHVLVNRIHPQTHAYWRSGGRDHQALMHAIGAERSIRPDDYIAPRAKTIEVQYGQMSFQRWLRTNISPLIDAMIDAGRSWDAIQGRLGAEYGVQFGRQANALMIVDDHPSRQRANARVHKPLMMHATALRSRHDLDLIERAASKNGLPHARTVRHDRGYVAAVTAYTLRTPQVDDPAIAPLYNRYIAERADWNARGSEEARKQRALIALSRDARIAKMRLDNAEEVKAYLAIASPEQTRYFKNVAEYAVTELRRDEIRQVREEARRQIDEVMLRYPSDIFRRWLKRTAGAGDLDARDAIAYLRTGKSTSLNKMIEPVTGVRAAVDSPMRKAASSVEETERPTALMSDDQQITTETDDGIRRGTAERVTRVQSIADAIEAFGDRTEIERLVYAYRKYLATFVTSDSLGQTMNQLGLAEKRKRVIDEWARAERKVIDATPNGSRSPEHALHLVRRLRNEAGYQEATTVERAVIACLTQHGEKMSLNAFLGDLDEPQAKYLAQILPTNLSFTYPAFEPQLTRDRRFLRELEGKQVGQHVRFSITGLPAFEDRGDTVIAHKQSSTAGNRAALEYAVVKFGQPIELTGSRTYRTRMLALAVEMNIPISDAELQSEQTKLIDEKRKAEPNLTLDPIIVRNKIAETYARVVANATLTPDERKEQLDTIFLDTLKGQLLIIKPILETTIDGAEGRVQNVYVFGNRAFAVVSNDEGEYVFRVPRSMARELATAIGETRDLTRERLVEHESVTLDELAANHAKTIAKPVDAPELEPQAAPARGRRR